MDWTERISACSSTVGEASSGSSSASTCRYFSLAWKAFTRARTFPSTSTLTVPSGSRSSWMMVPTVPTAKMSSSPGSLVLAFFWAHSRMALSPFMASSRAAIDFCRPTKSGTTMCGKTMMSRSGSSGRLRCAGPGLPSSRVKSDTLSPGRGGRRRWAEIYHRRRSSGTSPPCSPSTRWPAGCGGPRPGAAPSWPPHLAGAWSPTPTRPPPAVPWPSSRRRWPGCGRCTPTPTPPSPPPAGS